ncbi:MATE family efflux transporter [Pseudoalteromonas luteoviolacea]|uniref:MATE family efflux transporter n=1 Tax=Pseudoalteromonas luteoviolacea TaxID=43657 RepID=UPI00115148BB|nr:MATE family efflux transporter [Pseudoalteromonas luteoviolacea]TQF72939.1 MATE family efflux transporter [Pseudoalteromonas luteoviolacea]
MSNIQIVKRLYGIAVPIFISSSVALLAIFLNTAIVGHAVPNSLYILGIFLPISIVFMAVHESLRVSAIAFSAEASGNQQYDLLNQRLQVLVVASSLIFLGIYLLFEVLKFDLLSLYNIADETYFQVVDFTRAQILLSALVMLSIILMSSLYALGKPFHVTVVTVVGFGANVTLTYILVTYSSAGLYSLVYSTVITSVLSIVIALFMLKRTRVIHLFSDFPSQIKAHLLSIKHFSGPVFFSYLVMFLNLFLLNKLLATFSQNDVAGFGVAYRIQNIILMPAIATGVALGVHANRLKASGEFALVRRFINVAMGSVLLIYVVVSPLVFVYKEFLLSLLTNSSTILKAASFYLHYIAPTYIVTGPLLVLLVYMQETGQGVRSLLFNISALIVQMSLASYAVFVHDSLELMYQVLVSTNILILGYLFYEIRRSHLQYRRAKSNSIGDSLTAVTP